MNKSKKIIIAVSGTVSVVIVAGAFVVAHKRQKSLSAVPSIITEHSVSKTELAKADGKNGHDCLVAVDGTVYKIADFSLWQNGQHTPSNGLAYCGADLSKVIDKAPHGRSKLNILPKIGPLKD